MMLKTATVVALAAGLTQGAAVDAGSNLGARQARPCPVNGLACGWYLLGGADTLCIPNRGVLDNINSTVNVFNSIWRVENSVPVAWVQECRSCSNAGDVPNTVCSS
ncbi:hypothetical protein B0I37DRAFT_419407 [Chaetomium sp. MPI-CAGE-AT-0009]|nr:hypothetical protein B0I37DRAFT_419407 [Chaetomium sp. MPI-CAGE-AT-0009]